MPMQLEVQEIRSAITRLKRAHGQLAAVIRMLEAGEECEAAIIQLAAVSKALDKAGFSIIASGLKQCLSQDEDGNNNVNMEKLEKLFLSLS